MVSFAMKIVRRPESPNWYFQWMDGGQMRRRSLGTTDRAEAERLCADLSLGYDNKLESPELHKDPELLKKECYWLWRRARDRALRKKIPFDMTAEELVEQLRQSGGRCTMTGIPLETKRGDKFWKNPWIPSLDRIDAEKGYVSGNVRVVCWAANVAMGRWGQEVLFRMADSMVRLATGLPTLKRTPSPPSRSMRKLLNLRDIWSGREDLNLRPPRPE